MDILNLRYVNSKFGLGMLFRCPRIYVAVDSEIICENSLAWRRNQLVLQSAGVINSNLFCDHLYKRFIGLFYSHWYYEFGPLKLIFMFTLAHLYDFYPWPR